MIRIARGIALDEAQIEERFIRASGPGGQNVNKTATAVQLRFNIDHCPVLTDTVRERLRQIAPKRIDARGFLTIEARRYREQARNRQDALERLVALLRKAAKLPEPRMRTRPTLASKQRRLDEKRKRSETKKRRKPIARVD